MDSTGDQTATFDTPGPELAPRLLAKLRVEVPGYQLLDEIGSGGQATVYRARELTSGLTVAIKILHAGPNADHASRERFRRETAALKALNHPNIVCVIESGQTPAGLDYLVMNYVDGKPLDVLWKDRKLAAKIAPEPPARLRLFKKICDLVQAAHRAGITHRDLSPSNILLDDRGEPHVLDFGLAATAFDALKSPNGRNVTVTGQFIGKLKYASPEQARGTRDAIDIRSDVYSLGVILYQILTHGAFPYEVVGNFVDVLNNIIHSAPMSPSKLLATRNARTIAGAHPALRHGPALVNETIEAVVLKALEKNPKDRYESAGALGEDIERYLAGIPTVAKLNRAVSQGQPKPARRFNPRAIFITALSTLLTMGVLMNTRSILRWLGFSALPVALAAGPAVQQAGTGMGPGARRAGPAMVAPQTPRLRPALGHAPKAQFQVNNKTIHVDPHDAGVRAVRALPPQNFDPVSRRRSVNEFYEKQFRTRNPSKAELARLYVGPFRPEFVYWALYGWTVRDRAWWAWNNRRYFELELWNQWMQEAQFAAMIAEYEAAHSPQTLGFVPEQYASNPAEAIYCDQYIDAIYNPVYTAPSIVVDGSAGARLANLIEGAPRTYGVQTTMIGRLADSAGGLQFLTVPANFDPTYQIEVKRDGILYAFGPRKTPLQEGVGDDAPHWHPASDVIHGQGIDAVYQRNVAAGEKIRLHGYEWSIASEQIDVLDTASPAASSAVALADAELGQMIKSDDPVFVATPELKDYLRIAQGAEQGMLTPLGNVDDDKVGLYYGALSTVEKSCQSAYAQSSDPQLIAGGKELVRQVRGLEESLNAVDELRSPDSVESQNGANDGMASVATPPETVNVAAIQPVLTDSEAAAGGNVVVVPADRPTAKYAINGPIAVTPDPDSRWNTSPGRTHDCDYNGHVIPGQKAANGMNYMRLCYRLNGGRLIAITGPTVVDGNGAIEFGPSDLEGGGRLGNNTGSIRVTITKPGAGGAAAAAGADENAAAPFGVAANHAIAPQALNGTLCTIFKGGNFEVFVNGKSYGTPADKAATLYRMPMALHHGDVLLFRVSSRFAFRSLRFAYVDASGSAVFTSTAANAVIRQQPDPSSPAADRQFDGAVAAVGRGGDSKQGGEWDGAGLPATADWIKVPEKGSTYEIATTVP